MKIGIVAAHNICYSPFIFFYTQLLDNAKIEYELIYPNRSGIDEKFDGISHIVSWNKNLNTALNYVIYSRKVIKIIKKQKYDALILLFTNTAVFLSDWVKKYYKNRYIVDIRDYTHENNKLYFKLEKTAVENSLVNVISSKKFTDFLPKEEYLVCHNISVEKPYREHHFKKAKGTITIGYMGRIGYIEQCKRLMYLVSKDDRFKICFYGETDDAENLKKFLKQLNCDNINFYGRYEPSEKPEIIKKSDILFNVYGNSSYLVKCAISNKFYDSMYYHKPILTSPQTYMDEMADKVAYSMDLENMKSLDGLYDWYNDLVPEEVDEFCSRTFEQVLKENNITKTIITNKLKSIVNNDGD